MRKRSTLLGIVAGPEDGAEVVKICSPRPRLLSAPIWCWMPARIWITATQNWSAFIAPRSQHSQAPRVFCSSAANVAILIGFSFHCTPNCLITRAASDSSTRPVITSPVRR